MNSTTCNYSHDCLLKAVTHGGTRLPFTGLDVIWLAAIAAILIVVGLAALAALGVEDR